MHGEGHGRRGEKKKTLSLPGSSDISIFFLLLLLHKFAISLKGRCKLGLLTNELLGQDVYFQ